MDNLTHSLTGLMLSRAAFNRFTPRATALLMIASNLPDADIVTALGGSLTYLDHHRGITHALVSTPAVAAVTVAIVRLFGKLPLWKALLTAWAGAVIHLLLDWTNTYGIRMFLPFSDAWPRLDITYIVDIWIWGALVAAVAGPALSRLVSSEIGAKPGTGRGAAIVVLLFLFMYEGARIVLHDRAIATLNSHSYEGRPAKRVAAFPHPADPFRWNSYVEGDGFIITQSIHLLGIYDPLGGEKIYLPQPSVALERARQTDTFQRYLRFAQFPLWQITPVEKPEGGVRVEAFDLRFGTVEAKRFTAYAVLDASARVIEEAFTYGAPPD